MILKGSNCTRSAIISFSPASKSRVVCWTDTRKLKVIKKVWSPRSDPFVFPRTIESGGRSRKFNQAWLQQFPWLVYSKLLDGAFCFPCVLPARECGRNAGRLDKLVKTPVTFWTTAMSRFARHSNGRCEVHNLARTMRQQTVPIDQQLNNLLRQQIARTREIMGSLFKTVIFCGRNNIALRGRRDDDPSNENLQGNFQALLVLRIDSGDQTLQGHLNTAPRNARYISKTIQNEMITTLGKYISNNLSREVRESNYFPILADEAADISNKEHLSVVIRFVDSGKNI